MRLNTKMFVFGQKTKVEELLLIALQQMCSVAVPLYSAYKKQFKRVLRRD